MSEGLLRSRNSLLTPTQCSAHHPFLRIPSLPQWQMASWRSSEAHSRDDGENLPYRFLGGWNLARSTKEGETIALCCIPFSIILILYILQLFIKKNHSVFGLSQSSALWCLSLERITDCIQTQRFALQLQAAQLLRKTHLVAGWHQLITVFSLTNVLKNVFSELIEICNQSRDAFWLTNVHIIQNHRSRCQNKLFQSLIQIVSDFLPSVCKRITGSHNENLVTG